jgi:hypothetical protein
MTMHLEGPWLSTTGKQKGPKKWASAEAKHKSKMLQDEWNAKLKQWGVAAEEKRQRRSLSAPPLAIAFKTPPGRETVRAPSQDTGMIACVKVADPVYTGTKIKGIGTMHKSNAVPVFTDEEAIAISSMRR